MDPSRATRILSSFMCPPRPHARPHVVRATRMPGRTRRKTARCDARFFSTVWIWGPGGAFSPRGSVANLVLVDEPVEGLPVDPGGLGRRGDIAAMALEQIAQIRALELPHP